MQEMIKFPPKQIAWLAIRDVVIRAVCLGEPHISLTEEKDPSSSSISPQPKVFVAGLHNQRQPGVVFRRVSVPLADRAADSSRCVVQQV